MKKKQKNLMPIPPPAPPLESVASSPEPPVPKEGPATSIPSPKSLPEPTVPVKFYPNSDTCKVQILSDNKNKSGIYMWTNNINKKIYIGSSQNLRKRFRGYFNTNHLLTYTNMNICKALLKHGYSNFSLTILEYCEPSKCLEREGYYQKKLNPEYNIAKEPGAPMSGRTHSDVTKTIMSDAKKGKTLSEKTKQIMSDARTGSKHSNKTKSKISDAL